MTCLVCALGLAQFPVEEVDGLLDLADLLDEAVVHRVAAHLHVGTVRPRLKSRLGDLRTAETKGHFSICSTSRLFHSCAQVFRENIEN